MSVLLIGIFLLFSFLYPIPHLTPTFARAATPSASPIIATISAQIATPRPLGQVSPQSPQYANLMVNNLLHSFGCLAAGYSPIGPCVDYANGVPIVSSVTNSGGILGSVSNLNTLVLAYPPIRTGQYLATIQDSLGLVKEAHAQVGGTGEGVLQPILALWQISRNISYIIMIFIFVIIGLMIMFRARINPQTVISIQAALPGLVIGLILITFSYFMASMLTDTAYLATNLVGYYFTAAQGTPTTDLVDKVSSENVLSIMGKLANGIGREEIITGIASFFDGLVDPASRLVRGAAALAAYQLGSSFGPAIGGLVGGGICAVPGVATTIVTGGIGAAILAAVPLCAGFGSLVGGVAVGGALAAITAANPPAMVGYGLWVVAIFIIIYSMFKLLLRLINCYLTIIFLTITAPFQFLIASLPGRQEMAVDWIRNMLCNVLAFPAVLGVFYFVNYILGPVIPGSPFTISSTAALSGTSTLPLFGGLDVSFIRILVAFGALVAVPSIPDIVCQAIGKVGRAGALIGQEIEGGIRGGQGRLSQARDATGNLDRDIRSAGNLRSDWEPTFDPHGQFTGWRAARLGPAAKIRARGLGTPPPI